MRGRWTQMERHMLLGKPIVTLTEKETSVRHTQCLDEGWCVQSCRRSLTRHIRSQGEALWSPQGGKWYKSPVFYFYPSYFQQQKPEAWLLYMGGLAMALYLAQVLPNISKLRKFCHSCYNTIYDPVWTRYDRAWTSSAVSLQGCLKYGCVFNLRKLCTHWLLYFEILAKDNMQLSWYMKKLKMNNMCFMVYVYACVL